MKTARIRIVGWSLPVLLAACGGGGGDGAPDPSPASCSVAEQKSWLASYMNEWYFWYRISPRADAAAYDSVEAYYRALLYTGSDAAYPPDRWSYSDSTESFNRFYGDGATLGYGISVAGLELSRDPTKPLYVRYVEPSSPGATQDVRRGDQLLRIAGRDVAGLIADDDFSALTPSTAGQTLALVLRRDGVERSVTLTAAIHPLTPVTGAQVQTTAGGRKLAYLSVKDMVSQALAPAEAAFAQFKAAGVQDLVFDLRYNGGGLVSTGATLSSHIAGSRGAGIDYARLLYNDKRAASNNSSFAFSQPTSALSLPRVFVLAGQRTCSASEQVINGLRGAGIEVVVIGGTTCGKPVGFLPSSACGRTYSAVNFESVNQRGEGRYFGGFTASCAVNEDFRSAQGRSGDPLYDAAAHYADRGACPTGTASALAAPRRAEALPRSSEGDTRQGMIPR